IETPDVPLTRRTPIECRRLTGARRASSLRRGSSRLRKTLDEAAVDRNPGCPPARALVELIDGQLVEPDLSELSRHLEGCPACQETARTLSSSDALVESLRGEAHAEDQIARAVPRPLVERMKQIPRHAPRVEADTVGLSRDAAAPPAGPEFDFL